jgi:hypothetical protein
MPPRRTVRRRAVPDSGALHRRSVLYAEVAALVVPLAERIRTLEAEQKAALRDVDAAREVCGAAYDRLVTAVGALRRLTQVLTDNACNSGRAPDPAAVLAEVQQLLTGE